MSRILLQRICLALFMSFIGLDAMAQNVGIGTATPMERLHVAGAIRANSLAGVGTRVVGSDANGTLVNIAPGTNGQVLTQTAGGPAWQNAINIHSVSNANDIQISSATYVNVPAMTLTFTATSTEAFVMLTGSGFAFTNSMAYVQFRVRNGATTIGGTNTKMQSYDDVTGTVTSWSCAFNSKVTGLVVGNSYTFTVQGSVDGILGTNNAAIFTASDPDAHHLTLTVIQ